MNFTFQPSEENDIMHYAAGSQKQGAKYISRIKKNGKWVYKYAKDKVDYLKKHGLTTEVKKTSVSGTGTTNVTISDKSGVIQRQVRHNNASINIRPTYKGNKRTATDNRSSELQKAIDKKPEIDALYKHIDMLTAAKREAISSGNIDQAKLYQETINKKQKELKKLQRK